GTGDYLVAEADESDGSFLLLAPTVAVVTNVDNDHLDYYKSFANIRRAFQRHLERVSPEGAAVLCADDPELSKLVRKAPGRVITYGIAKKAEWRAARLELAADGSSFDVLHRGRLMAKARLKVPGRHNVLNALGAIAAGSFLGFPLKR